MKKVTSGFFIWIIIIMSTLGLFDILIFNYTYNEFSIYLSILTSTIGLIGVVLYYKKIDFFKYLILFWIIIQFIELSEYLINADGVKYWRVIFKSKQFFEFKIGHTFDVNNMGYKLQLNFVPILYLFFFQTLSLSTFRGKIFEVLKFRDNNDYDPNVFAGKIIEQFTLGVEAKSFLVKLNMPLTDVDKKEYNYCIISESKSKQFGLDRDLNINLYLISNEKITRELKIGIMDLKYVDWIEGRITNPNKGS